MPTNAKRAALALQPATFKSNEHFTTVRIATNRYGYKAIAPSGLTVAKRIIATKFSAARPATASEQLLSPSGSLTFPRSRIVGGKSIWRSDEVEAWLDALPVRTLKGDSAPDEKAG
jgi:hypothetical protein